jgi:hypothetical protein
MAIATHIIKIKGTFDNEKWTEEQLRCLVRDKIKDEIESIYHPDLELFQVKDGSIEVWVYISDLTPLELLEKNIRDWLKNHIKEEGLTIDNVEIEKSGNGFYVVTP